MPTKIVLKKAKGKVKKDSVDATRVAIIGAGRGGKALMEIFAEDPLVKIVGLAEIKAKTAGLTLASKLGIPVMCDYRDLLNMKHVDLIIDVTGNPVVEHALLETDHPNLAIVGGASAKFMWQLIEARIRATNEIEKTLTRYQSLFRLYVKEEAEGAVSEERTRIACEIHDGLVQTLVGLNFKLDRCRQLVREAPAKCLRMLQETKGQLKHAIQEARQAIFNLRPGQDEKLELVSALSNYLNSYKVQDRVQIDFAVTGDEARLDPKVKMFLFRIVQEALSNVRQHAKASRVAVHLTIDRDRLTGTITDNGIGFDVREVSQNPEKWDHFGLRGMRARARLLGGDAHWDSEKGRGARITIEVPIGETTEEALNGQEN